MAAYNIQTDTGGLYFPESSYASAPTETIRGKLVQVTCTSHNTSASDDAIKKELDAKLGYQLLKKDELPLLVNKIL